MTRQEFLESQEQDLADEVVRDARTLQHLTRNVERRFNSGTRDRIIQVAIRLHDRRVQLDTVRRELNQLAAAALLD